MTTAQRPRQKVTEMPEFQEALERFKVIYSDYRKEVDLAFNYASREDDFLPDLASVSARYEPRIKALVEEMFALGADTHDE